MRIISINLNKRLGNSTVARFVESWLRTKECGVLLAQEPWVHGRSEPVCLDSYRDVGGNSMVYAWIDSRLASPAWRLIQSNWMQIELGYLLLNNVYFSAYSQPDRISFFDILACGQPALESRPQVITGDFNFAPEPEDGRDGGRISTFNSSDERDAFRRLQQAAGLVDMTSPNLIGQRQ